MLTGLFHQTCLLIYTQYILWASQSALFPAGQAEKVLPEIVCDSSQNYFRWNLGSRTFVSRSNLHLIGNHKMGNKIHHKNNGYPKNIKIITILAPQKERWFFPLGRGPHLRKKPSFSIKSDHLLSLQVPSPKKHPSGLAASA